MWGDISTVLRVALTKRQQTPDLYEIMQVLGRSSIEKKNSIICKIKRDEIKWITI